jgi:hypothetical protein
MINLFFIRRFLSSGIQRLVVQWKSTYNSDEYVAYTFTAEESFLPASCWFLIVLTLQPWRWRVHVPPKSLFTFNGLHVFISHKMELLVIVAVRKSYLEYTL